MWWVEVWCFHACLKRKDAMVAMVAMAAMTTVTAEMYVEQCCRNYEDMGSACDL